MSDRIRNYRNAGYDDGQLFVDAYYGGDEQGQAVQLTIGGQYVQLSQDQVLDLIAVLTRRVKRGDRTMSATGHTDTKTVAPDGSLAVEGEEVL